MRNNRVVGYYWRCSLGLVLMLFFVAMPTLAQESPVTVSVNKARVSTDELVILTVTAIDASARQPRPVLPPLDGLAVVDLDIATNVKLVQGSIQTEVIYTYELQPRRTGTLTIPPIPVNFNDRVVETPPLEIEVQQGAAPAPSPGNAVAPLEIAPPPDLDGQDFYIESVVDETEPYVGQQIVYTFRFYQAIQLYRKPQLEMPILAGFQTLGMPVQEFNADINGRTYLISEIRTALFPKSSGRIKIGAAQLLFPGSFFEEASELYTQPVNIDVQPLPPNPPPGFGGAVGQYEMEMFFTPEVAILNQPSTLSVAISGVGNIQEMPEPIWPSLPNWRVYDSMTSQTAELRQGKMAGTRVFQRLIISDRLGELTIPPAKMVYFDPVAGAYRTIATQETTVRVIAPPTPNPATATASALAALPTVTPPALAALAPDQFTGPFANSTVVDSVVGSWGLVLPMSVALVWLLCLGIPAAAIVGAGGVWLWQRKSSRPSSTAPESETLAEPKQKLHPALKTALAQSDDNYRAVSLALTNRLSEILGTSAKGLTQAELTRRLVAQDVSPRHIEAIQVYLSQSEMARFGPKTDDAGWELMTQVDALLHALDEE